MSGNNAVLGNVFRAEISIDDGTSYVNIGGRTEVTTSREYSESKCSTMDTERFNEYLLGLGDVTADINGIYQLSDLGLARLFAMEEAGLSFKLKLYPKKLEGSGIRVTTWDAQFKSASEAATMDEAQNYSRSLRLQNPSYADQ